MGEATAIEWTATPGPDGVLHAGNTFNFAIGCTEPKDSPECHNCYARTGSRRLAAQHGLKLWPDEQSALEHDHYLISENTWRNPIAWNRKAERLGVRLKVFCESYGDVFEDHPRLVDPRDRLGELVLRTPSLDWLLLTKRPENIERLAPRCWSRIDFPRNVWLGTTVGVRSSRPRVTALLRAPRATVKFLSCEPMLEDIAHEYDGLAAPICPECFEFGPCECLSGKVLGGALTPGIGVDWVIIGSESGPRRREMRLEWATAVVAVARRSGAVCFVKQISTASDPKGGDPRHWPPGDWPRDFPWMER